ncbi:hypothetical protein KP509_12G075600 [Ceratopteris richardii]|uniref:Uncharacterized protein n=1 Tax=Ceratopteris richardii TaxID=49495 RepID=A0A8T2TN44_CERRI|nr:hypothetical protein KP509_12G075600 [Ceratopteris richardii]
MRSAVPPPSRTNSGSACVYFLLLFKQKSHLTSTSCSLKCKIYLLPFLFQMRSLSCLCCHVTQSQCNQHVQFICCLFCFRCVHCRVFDAMRCNSAAKANRNTSESLCHFLSFFVPESVLTNTVV